MNNIKDLISILKNVDDPIHIWDHPILNECILCLINYNVINNKKLVKTSNYAESFLTKSFQPNILKEGIKHSLSYNRYVYYDSYKYNTIIYDITDLEAYVRKVKIENILKM